MAGSKTINNLTEGNSGRQLLAFAVPFLLSNLLQSLYNITDMMIVSRFVGVTAISAVNNGGQIMTVVVNVISGLTLGGTIVIGKHLGAGDREGLTKTIGSFISMISAIGIIFTIIFMLFTEQMLELVKTPADAMGDAVVYLRIYSSGVISIFGYNALAAILRGVGNSKRPLLFVAVSTVLNTVLDLLFVGVFKLGAAGAAAATVISIFASFAMALVFFLRQKDLFDIKPENLKIHADKLKQILKVGFPSALQYTVFGLSLLFITSFVNKYGVAASAAAGIGAKLDGFFLMPLHALSSATSAMISQNIGAKKIDRVKEILFTSVKYQFIISVVLFIFSRSIPRQLYGLFTDDAEVIGLGVYYIQNVSFNYLLSSFLLPFNSLAIGVGNTVFTLCTTIMNGFVFRVPIALFFENVAGMGLQGVFLGMGFANIGGALAGYIHYKSGVWKKR